MEASWEPTTVVFTFRERFCGESLLWFLGSARYPALWPSCWDWDGGNHQPKGSTGSLRFVPQWKMKAFPALLWHSQPLAEEAFPGAYTWAWWVSTRLIFRKLQEPFPHKDSQPFLCSSCQREDHRGNIPSLSPPILTVFNQRHRELETDKLYLEYGTAQGKRVVFQLTKNSNGKCFAGFFQGMIQSPG